MKLNPKKIIFTILPIALGVLLIWYSLSKLKPNDIESIKNSFKTANYWWVIFSLVLGILSHLSRAYRWQFMLDPLGYRPKFANNIMAVLVAYLVNLIVPRAGEIARATTISKYEHIPFEKAFGTIVSERVADVIMLLGIMALAFIYQTELLSSYLFKEEDSGSGYTFYILGALVILGVLFIWLIRKSKNPLVIKIQTFIQGLIQGVVSIFRMKRKWAFIFHTVFIWTMYVLMFYVGVRLGWAPTVAIPNDDMSLLEKLHIIALPGVLNLIEGAALSLVPGGVLLAYGPFRFSGRALAPSNERFDEWLKARNSVVMCTVGG